MRLSDHRRAKRINPGSWKRVIWYLILLIVTLILIWQMPEIARRWRF
jgi:hypothetical protein